MAKRLPAAPKPAPLAPTWERADPQALATFDESTKRCTMNCGPHAQDPRSHKERKFLCGDCETLKREHNETADSL